MTARACRRWWPRSAGQRGGRTGPSRSLTWIGALRGISANRAGELVEGQRHGFTARMQEGSSLAKYPREVAPEAARQVSPSTGEFAPDVFLAGIGHGDRLLL